MFRCTIASHFDSELIRTVRIKIADAVVLRAVIEGRGSRGIRARFIERISRYDAAYNGVNVQPTGVVDQIAFQPARWD